MVTSPPPTTPGRHVNGWITHIRNKTHPYLIRIAELLHTNVGLRKRKLFFCNSVEIFAWRQCVPALLGGLLVQLGRVALVEAITMRPAFVHNSHLASCWRPRLNNFLVLSSRRVSCSVRLHTIYSGRPVPNASRPIRSLATASVQPTAPPISWIDRLPPRVRPYLHLIRADKPIGSALLFLPCGEYVRNSVHH